MLDFYLGLLLTLQITEISTFCVYYLLNVYIKIYFYTIKHLFTASSGKYKY